MAGGETQDPGAGWLTPTPELGGLPRAGTYTAAAPRAFSLTPAPIPAADPLSEAESATLTSLFSPPVTPDGFLWLSPSSPYPQPSAASDRLCD